jgi:hypothetical protein
MSFLFSLCDWVGSVRFCRSCFRLAIGSALGVHVILVCYSFRRCAEKSALPDPLVYAGSLGNTYNLFVSSPSIVGFFCVSPRRESPER